MHGSVMMFLFAVPVIEAIGILLLPAMLGARDLPFPRLSAYAFWAYFVGGIVFFGTIFFDVAPDGGWFMYPPLTSFEFSPGLRSDFWLLGIGFIEISAIAGAIEIVVGILRTRPPGMTLDKMPVYVWAMLIVGGMIIFGFPPVILATALLELERAFHWPFFIAEQGGDPVLWQHLFWLFGHPDVYIIFLPGAGLVSMIIPTMARACHRCHRIHLVRVVGPSHVCDGNAASHDQLFLRGEHGGGDSRRHSSICLDRDAASRPRATCDAHLVHPRLFRNLRSRWIDRCDACRSAVRLAGT
jgi:cytochrome c oxidase subunit I+III